MAHCAPVPGSFLDSQELAHLVRELEDGVRAAAMEIVRSVFAAELARLEAEVAGSRAASAVSTDPTVGADPAAPPSEPSPRATTPDVAPVATPEDDPGLEHGTVKWWSDNKGYGFIAGDDGHDVFVHRKALVASGLRTLRDGQRVRYAEEPGAKGPVATRVSAV